MNTTNTLKTFLTAGNMFTIQQAAIEDQKGQIKVTSSDYVVRYGFSFSHLTEYKIFKLYRDAVKFFYSLPCDMYQSAFLYKQDYIKSDQELGSLAADTVEYKKYYSEIKNNSHILELMMDGEKF